MNAVHAVDAVDAVDAVNTTEERRLQGDRCAGQCTHHTARIGTGVRTGTLTARTFLTVTSPQVRRGSSKEVWALVKGSPEAVGALLTQRPAGYEDTYREMAERGLRVLALAYRTCAGVSTTEAAQKPRDWVESELTFAGFLAFTCLPRKDTRVVIQVRGCRWMSQADESGGWVRPMSQADESGG